MKGLAVINWALFILRASLGIVFLAHGLQKIFGEDKMQEFISMMATLNLAPASSMAWAAALTEAVAGLFLILGILPRISALGIAVIMAVAIWKVHAVGGFFAMNGGFEYQFLIIGVCLTLILTGAGKISLLNKL